MFKEGWCVRLGQEEVARGWGNCLKYLQRGWKRKEWNGNKDIKKGGKQGQGMGTLKGGGGLELLLNYEMSSILLEKHALQNS